MTSNRRRAVKVWIPGETEFLSRFTKVASRGNFRAVQLRNVAKLAMQRLTMAISCFLLLVFLFAWDHSSKTWGGGGRNDMSKFLPRTA